MRKLERTWEGLNPLGTKIYRIFRPIKPKLRVFRIPSSNSDHLTLLQHVHAGSRLQRIFARQTTRQTPVVGEGGTFGEARVGKFAAAAALQRILLFGGGGIVGGQHKMGHPGGGEGVDQDNMEADQKAELI